MADESVPIGRVKRDISSLVNRVAYGGERIVLTSRGKAKAALVGMDEYARLSAEGDQARTSQWRAWLAQADTLAERIMSRRGGEPVPVGDLLRSDRQDLEARHGSLAGGD